MGEVFPRQIPGHWEEGEQVDAYETTDELVGHLFTFGKVYPRLGYIIIGILCHPSNGLR